MNTIQERLVYLVDNLYGGNVTRFLEDNKNISKSSIYRYLRGDIPSYDFIVNLYNNGIDLYWLMVGKGTMFADNNAGQLKKIMVEKEYERIGMLRKGLLSEPIKEYSNNETSSNLEETNQ